LLPEIAAEQLVPEHAGGSVRQDRYSTNRLLYHNTNYNPQATFIQQDAVLGQISMAFGFCARRYGKKMVPTVLKNSKRIRITGLDYYFSHERFFIKISRLSNFFTLFQPTHCYKYCTVLAPSKTKQYDITVT
jgi:hypothetical protein